MRGERKTIDEWRRLILEFLAVNMTELISQGKIAKALETTKQTVSKHIGRFVGEGYIRERNIDDTSRIYFITPEGLEKVNEYKEVRE